MQSSNQKIKACKDSFKTEKFTKDISKRTKVTRELLNSVKTLVEEQSFDIEKKKLNQNENIVKILAYQHH